MTEYVEKATILSKCEEMWNNADETTQTGVDTINAIDRITDYIESLPAADVQLVKRGRWVECCNELDKKCSCCDKVHGTIYEREPFCPNCGARMDGDIND